MSEAAPPPAVDRLDVSLADQNFPVFLTKFGPALHPIADPRVGPPVIILSVPKSGTYFTEALYKRMGYQAVFVHAMNEFCNDWRFADWGGLKPIPVTALIPLVLPGQILVSHCGRTPEIEAALVGFKKIYLYRNLREVLVSHTRADADEPVAPDELPEQVARFCRDRGERLVPVIQGASLWRNCPDVLAIDFADLTAPAPARQAAVAGRFAAFMGWPAQQILAALQAVPGDETATKTPGGRSLVAGAWNEECEAWFQAHLASVEVRPDAVAG